MSEGQVLCLDTIRQSFVEQEDVCNGYLIAEVNKLSMVDIGANKCLSVSNNGLGIVH